MKLERLPTHKTISPWFKVKNPTAKPNKVSLNSSSKKTVSYLHSSWSFSLFFWCLWFGCASIKEHGIPESLKAEELEPMLCLEEAKERWTFQARKPTIDTEWKSLKSRTIPSLHQATKRMIDFLISKGIKPVGS